MGGAGAVFYPLEEIIAICTDGFLIYLPGGQGMTFQVPSSSQPRIEAARQDYVCVWKSSDLLGTKALHKWQVQFP